jgi:hypothetical protein
MAIRYVVAGYSTASNRSTQYPGLTDDLGERKMPSFNYRNNSRRFPTIAVTLALSALGILAGKPCFATVISLVCHSDGNSTTGFSWEIDDRVGTVDGKRPNSRPLRVTSSKITWEITIRQRTSGRELRIAHEIDRYTGGYTIDAYYTEQPVDSIPLDSVTGTCKSASHAF